jgi:hypothetical protein
MKLIFFKLHDVEISFSYVEQFRDIFLPDDMTTPKSGTLVFTRNDLGNVVGERHSDGFFDRNNFQHDCGLLGTL